MLSMSHQRLAKRNSNPLPQILFKKCLELSSLTLENDSKVVSKCYTINCIDCKLHPFSPSRQLKNSYCQYNWEISPTYSSTGRTEKEPKYNFVEI